MWHCSLHEFSCVFQTRQDTMRLCCTRSMTLVTNDSHISYPRIYDTFQFFSLNQLTVLQITSNLMTAWTCTFVEKWKLSWFFLKNESKVSLLKRRNLWRVMYSNRSLSAHLILPSQSSWLGYQNKTEWTED